MKQLSIGSRLRKIDKVVTIETVDDKRMTGSTVIFLKYHRHAASERMALWRGYRHVPRGISVHTAESRMEKYVAGVL